MNDLFGRPAPIKALSLWQPWSSLVAIGLKLHETRSWATKYRGRLAIHAAKHLDVDDAPAELCRHAFGDRWATRLPRGAIVAVADLTASRPTEQLIDFVKDSDRRAGNFGPGRFGFRLENVRPLDEPILARGAQGLFDWEPPPDLELRLQPPVSHAAAAKAWLEREEDVAAFMRRVSVE